MGGTLFGSTNRNGGLWIGEWQYWHAIHARVPRYPYAPYVGYGYVRSRNPAFPFNPEVTVSFTFGIRWDGPVCRIYSLFPEALEIGVVERKPPSADPYPMQARIFRMPGFGFWNITGGSTQGTMLSQQESPSGQPGTPSGLLYAPCTYTHFAGNLGATHLYLEFTSGNKVVPLFKEWPANTVPHPPHGQYVTAFAPIECRTAMESSLDNLGYRRPMLDDEEEYFEEAPEDQLPGQIASRLMRSVNQG